MVRNTGILEKMAQSRIMEQLGQSFKHTASYAVPHVIHFFLEASNEQFTYEITNSLLNWTEARQRCLQVGGDLASVLSAEDQSKVAALMVNHGNYWIGLNDRTTEGTFVWSDGNAVSFQNWAPGEPNDHEHDEDCATAVYGKLSDYEYHKNWNDLACWNRLKSICKIPGKIIGSSDTTVVLSD